MRRDGWTAEVTVAADLSKVPDGPVEGAKYAMDQVHQLASPWVKVEHHVGGTTETWMVDTSDGTVTHIGTSMSDPDREELPPSPESACEWPNGGHYDGAFRVLDEESGTPTITCGGHLLDIVSGAGDVTVSPYEPSREFAHLVDTGSHTSPVDGDYAWLNDENGD